MKMPNAERNLLMRLGFQENNLVKFLVSRPNLVYFYFFYEHHFFFYLFIPLIILYQFFFDLYIY